MISLAVDTAGFTRSLQQYAAVTGKAIGEVVKEQAKLLAKRLQDLTYPKTASQGKKRVAIDIGKVYLQNSWFENTFGFTKQALGDRVKQLVRSQDVAALEKLFENSQRLNKIHIEAFDAAKHKQAQRKGRVNYKQPFSFPLAEQSRVKSLEKEKKAKVGFAKSGWAACYNALGGSVPSWLAKATGHVDEHSQQQDPYITLVNDVSYFAAIDSGSNVVARALAGRSTDMLKAAENAIRRAKQSAGIL
jgi:hypothetical protein